MITLWCIYIKKYKWVKDLIKKEEKKHDNQGEDAKHETEHLADRIMEVRVKLKAIGFQTFCALKQIASYRLKKTILKRE